MPTITHYWTTFLPSRRDPIRRTIVVTLAPFASSDALVSWLSWRCHTSDSAYHLSSRLSLVDSFSGWLIIAWSVLYRRFTSTINVFQQTTAHIGLLMWTRRKMLLRQFISKFATQGGVYRKLLCCVKVEWTEDKNPRMVKIVSHFNLSLLFLAFRVEGEALQLWSDQPHLHLRRPQVPLGHSSFESTRFQGRVVLFMLRCRYSDNRILWHCWGMANVSQ